jgi:hypothetical protein
MRVSLAPNSAIPPYERPVDDSQYMGYVKSNVSSKTERAPQQLAPIP